MSVPLTSGEFTCTTIVTTPEAGGDWSPRLQVTRPPAWLHGAPSQAWKVVLCGTVSLIVTFSAGSLPLRLQASV